MHCRRAVPVRGCTYEGKGPNLRKDDSYGLTPLMCLGERFPGSRAELLAYMAGVGYTHIPGGHKVRVD